MMTATADPEVVVADVVADAAKLVKLQRAVPEVFTTSERAAFFI